MLPSEQKSCQYCLGTAVQVCAHGLSVITPQPKAKCKEETRTPTNNTTSIHELSPVATGEAYNRMAWARLWKSIIRSSTGRTAYPYCTYIRALSLGNYENMLEDIWNDSAVRPWLFNLEDDMGTFLVLPAGQTQSKRSTRKPNMGFINIQGTMAKCADSITRRIKEVADQTESAVTLAHLEANRIPMDMLPKWITRLGTLTSLRLRDGSVLNAEAGSAIFESCPKFSELTCLFCNGDDADENLSAFLQMLRPNSLRRFEIISLNSIGELTLTALNTHSESLKILGLSSLNGEAMKSLNVLPSCTELESLTIENSDRVDLKAFSQVLLKEITAWIQSCKGLRELTFSQVVDALLIVKEVLNTPTTCLKLLALQSYESQSEEHNSATWAALGLQDSLETLTLGGQDYLLDGLVLHESAPLTASICKLQNLKSLNLNQASVRTIDLRQIVVALPHLTELQFGGEWVDDPILETLSKLQYLKALTISAFSVFTFNALQMFASKLNSVDNNGIRVEIFNQIGELKFSEEDQAQLADYFANKLNGRFSIEYSQDPDELHESDFSVESD
jgi:hypothetical protein